MQGLWRPSNNPMFRPPAEADSLILQIDEGCPTNRCTFCGMYKAVRFRRRDLEDIEAVAAAEASDFPAAQRIFLADGDAMRRPFGELRAILELLGRRFPRLARVNLYANGSSIGAKSDDQLRELRSLKLHTLYMGLESGDESVLKRCLKGETAAGMVDAGVRAHAAGLRMSVMVLLGLGGADRCREHLEHTAEALNRMQPRLLSALRVIPIEGTALHDDARHGRFRPLTEFEIVGELSGLIQRLELRNSVFRANHSSNVVPLEGRLSRDRPRLLAELQAHAGAGALDRQSPGPMPLWL